jgi:hypothetical protein
LWSLIGVFQPSTKSIEPRLRYLETQTLDQLE